jgi:hypothetical protein
LEVKEKQLDYTFRFDGPLGRFAYKTELAYVFGLMDKDVAIQLNLIREMRNACARSKYKLSLEMPVLADVAILLFKPLGVVSPKENTAEGIRTAFLAECLHFYRHWRKVLAQRLSTGCATLSAMTFRRLQARPKSYNVDAGKFVLFGSGQQKNFCVL